MKFCPQCNLEYEDDRAFCTRDGSPLQARVAKPGVMKLGSRPNSAGALGQGALTASPSEGVAVPSMATLQAATVKAPPRAATVSAGVRAATPARGAPATYQKTLQASAAMQKAALAAQAFVAEDSNDLTSQTVLPDAEATIRPEAMPANDLMQDLPTVTMATSPALQHMQAPPKLEVVPEPEGDPDLSGRSIAGRYKLQKKLGEGGMGVVYAALDERIEKQVAVKVLREEFARRPDVVARFTQEARSAGRIKHENVLDVTDYGRTEDNSFYIAMELLVGTDLADVLQKETTLPPERGIDIAIQICRALGAAHREGVVHRDLKPENVFLVRSADGREVVKIVDFGIAQLKDASGAEGNRKLTRTGMIFGTPEYMSPEQAAGKPIDNRVDVYATGVILFEMFAGRVPFVGDTFMGVLTQHMFEAVPPLRQVNPECAANEDLEAVIFKALAKDPSQRYPTMADLAEDLLRVRNGLRPNAPSGYDGTGTFLRSQMLAGAGITPGAIQPSQPGAAPSAQQPATAVGVARTIEHELPLNRRSTGLYVGLGLAVVAAGVALAVFSMGGGTTPSTPTVAPQPARQPPPAPRPSPPTPTPALAVDAGAPAVARPTTARISVSTPGGVAEVRVHGESETRCPATPCEIDLPRGVLTTLVATSGSRRGTATVNTATGDQRIEIVLPPERVERSERGSRSSRGSRANPSAGSSTTPTPSGQIDRHGGRCQGPNDCNCSTSGAGLLIPCGL